MKRSKRSLRSVLVYLALFVAGASAAGAQTYQGALRGTVRDAQGVIPGAEVVLINEDTNAERPAMTNEVGEYAFSNVLPGPYTIRVSLPGFKTAERKGFRIGTQQSLVLDFLLEIGAISEQITVTGEAPLVERASATQSASLDQQALQNLPIFGRNPFYAAISTPGVIQTGDPQFVRYQDQSGSSQLSLGGGPRRGNGYLLEGVSITDLTNRPTIVPSMEAVEELKVQTKTYEADMGHAAGGVFNTTARSGSNTWHGSALLVTKPGATTGTLFFAKRAGLENPPQYYYNWAGSLGGPIRKDKTFFWFSTDDYKQRSTRNNVLTLPTAPERAGDLADAQQRRTARHDLRPAHDPHGERCDRARSVSRQRDSGGPDQRSGQGDVESPPASDLRQVVQRTGDARRRPAEPGNAEGRSTLERRVDDDGHVCPPVHAGTRIGLLRSARQRSG